MPGSGWISAVFASVFRGLIPEGCLSSCQLSTGEEKALRPDGRHGCYPEFIGPRTDPLRSSVPVVRLSGGRGRTR